MGYILEILRIYLISFEFLILLSIIIISYYVPSPFAVIGNELKSDSNLLKLLPSINLLILPVSITLAWKLLTPKGDSNTKILYKWEFRVIASIIFCVLAAMGSIAIWILSKKLSGCIIGVIFLSSIAVASIATFNQLMAAFKIREFLDVYQPDKS